MRRKKSEEEKKEMYSTAGGKKKSMLLDEMYISSASRRSRKVIKQLTSIEYSLVISRPHDGQVHVIVQEKKESKYFKKIEI